MGSSCLTPHEWFEVKCEAMMLILRDYSLVSDCAPKGSMKNSYEMKVKPEILAMDDGSTTKTRLVSVYGAQ